MKTKIIFIILFIVSLNLNSQVLQQWVTRTDYSGLRDNGNTSISELRLAITLGRRY